MEKVFKGKAIYMPGGKAAEYARWACNFYVGCSNGCSYCYLKKGRCAKVMGGDVAVLKKCFKNETDALQVFEKELKANLTELQKHGLFFSFTTDPMLPKTIELTEDAVGLAQYNKVPCKILTKRTEWVDWVVEDENMHEDHLINLVAFGFTLTGHDELEPGASTNAERIEAMKKLHEAGFKTFASIEPIIDLKSSFEMIKQTKGYCDLYKIGLEAGRKYTKGNLKFFKSIVFFETHYTKTEYLSTQAKIYYKDSFLKQAGIERSDLPDNCVGRDYNMFENK